MTIISLASESTTRKRVFQRFALDQSNVEGLSREIAGLRVAIYEDRLAQLADSLGVSAAPTLEDDAVLAALTRSARDSAFSVVHTHNDDLRSFLAQQPKGMSQSELAARVRTWEAERQGWKASQIAETEGYSAFNQADRDVLSRNEISTQMRVEPDTAECENCSEMIDRGWMQDGDVDFDLPLHPHCLHTFAYREPLAQSMQDKSQVWLGAWLDL